MYEYTGLLFLCCPCIASQSDASLRSKKISTTSFGSSTSGADYLSTTLERRQKSKEVSEVALGMYIDGTISRMNSQIFMYM